MSYVIACWKDGAPYGVTDINGSFSLLPLDSNSMMSKIHCYPHRLVASKILKWIQENDDNLNAEELSIQSYSRFIR